MANWEDGTKPVKFGKEWIVVKRGQILTSLAQLSADLNVTRRALRLSLQRNTQGRHCVTLTSPHGLLITICDYLEIQDSKNDNVTLTSRQRHTWYHIVKKKN